MDFYDVISDIEENLDEIELTVRDVWTSGEDIVPDEYAEDFETAVYLYGKAHEIFDKIHLALFKKYHDKE